MRVRCRSIAYETLALDASASECGQYEFLRIPSIELDQDCARRQLARPTDPLAFMETMVPSCYCYLRSIPIQPAIEAFTALIQNANNMDDVVRHQLSIVEEDSGFFHDDDSSHWWNMDATGVHTSNHQDLLLEFCDELETQAIAARKTSEALLPKFLKHTQTSPGSWDATTIVSSAMNQAPLLLNILMPHTSRMRFQREDHTDTCSGAKLEGRDGNNATDECLAYLLQNIHDCQGIEPYMVEKRPQNVEFYDWLRRRKDRWSSERMYRKSMRIVKDSQLCNKVVGSNENTQSSAYGFLNDNDFFIRMDPKLPELDQEFPVEERENEKGHDTNCVEKGQTRANFYKSSMFSSMDNPMSFQSKRSRSFGARNITNDITTEQSKLPLDFSSPGNEMRKYLDKHSILLKERNASRNESSICESVDINIELPIAYITADPSLPGRRISFPQRLKSEFDVSTMDLDHTLLSRMAAPDCKLPRLSKRRRDYKHLEPDEYVKGELYLPSTNGLHLQGIYSIVGHFRIEGGLFLPHLRPPCLEPFVQEDFETSLLPSVKHIAFTDDDKSRPSIQRKRRPFLDTTNNLLDPVNPNVWINSLNDPRRALSSFVLDELKSSNYVLYDVHRDFFETCDEHKHVLEASIAVRGEFLHLKKKVKDISAASESASSLDSVTMDLDKADVQNSTMKLRNVSKSSRELVQMSTSLLSNNIVAEETPCIDEGHETKYKGRKRSRRIDAKKLKRDRKRQKKEKKRERKASRKSKKRKAAAEELPDKKDKSHNDMPSTNSNAAHIPCIAITSLDVGMTPMVMTRKIQTVTEEVAFRLGSNISKRQNSCRFERTNHRNSFTKPTYDRPFSTRASSEEEGNSHGRFDILENGGHGDKNKAPNAPTETDKTILSEDYDSAFDITTPGVEFIHGLTDRNNTDPEWEEVSYKSKKSEGLLFEKNIERGVMTSEFCQVDALNPSISCPRSATGMTGDPSNAFNKNHRQHHQGMVNISSRKVLDEPYVGEHYSNSNSSTSSNRGFIDSNQKSPNIPEKDIPSCEEVDEQYEKLEPASSSLDPAFPLLCSESFLEQCSQAASELSSGRWIKALTKYPNRHCALIEDDFQTKFDLHDCSLVDDCGIDLEFPDSVAIKVLRLTSLFENSSFDGKESAKDFVKLSLSGRYEVIHFLVILDTLDSSYYHEAFTLIQNALVKQQGCPCQQISFQYLDSTNLSSIIAQLALSHQKPVDMNCYTLENQVMERATLLLGMSPSMTIHECISFLCTRKGMNLREILLDASKISQATRSHKNCLDVGSLLQMNSCFSSDFRSHLLH